MHYLFIYVFISTERSSAHAQEVIREIQIRRWVGRGRHRVRERKQAARHKK